MSEDKNEVEIVRLAGGRDVRVMDSPKGIFVWWTNPQTDDVMGAYAHEIHSVEDVKRRMAEAVERFR